MTLAVTLTVTGCSTSSKEQEAEKPPKHAKRVQMSVFDSSTRPRTTHLDVYDTRPPQRPFKVIALLTCEGAPKEEAVMMTAIIYRAQLIGADALMSADTAYTQEGGGFIWGSHGGFGGGSNTRCVFRAKAIVYIDK